MSLDSAIYIVFLIMVTLVYWRLRFEHQNWLLLVASYLFYGCWNWRFLALLVLSTCTDYWIAHRIESAQSTRVRKGLLTASLIVNLGILCYFKYLGFFVHSLTACLARLGVAGIPHTLLRRALPAAISFYTFQEVAYVFDVYRGKIAAMRSLRDYALFVSFFPHLIAGPIQQPSHLLPQVSRARYFDVTRVYDGIMLILVGLFRKCVIADSSAQLANASFAGKLGHTGWATLIGAGAFALQIYGDFSGYSDIARGSAQLLGFHFMVNFRQPYLATSLQEFWRRWHISLSTWLRDYLYIPLGGSRNGNGRTYANLLTTMLLGGLWHGASWNFVIWGGIHGLGLSIERMLGLTDLSSRPAARWLQRVFIFQLICGAWIFFRAETLASSAAMFRQLAHWQWSSAYKTCFLYLLIIAIPVACLDLYLERTGEEYPTQHAATGWQLATAASAIIFVAFASAYQPAPFIYFQF